MLNGEETGFSAVISEGDELNVIEGKHSISPKVALQELIDIPQPLQVTVNQQLIKVLPELAINGQPANGSMVLADRDNVVCLAPDILQDILRFAKISLEPVES